MQKIKNKFTYLNMFKRKINIEKKICGHKVLKQNYGEKLNI